jgi:hypothetical protein
MRIGDLPRPACASRNLAILAACLGIALGGCRKMPGGSSTSASEANLNPDSTAFAFGSEFIRYRNTTFLDELNDLGGGSAVAEHDYELHVFDLAHRTGPHRLIRWRVKPGESTPRIVAWVEEGILVEFGPRNRMRREVVDPKSSVSHRLDRESERAIDKRLREREHADGGRDERHRIHVERSTEGFFVWHPETRQKELLFTLPLHHEGESKPDSIDHARQVARDRYADTIHRVWEQSAVQGPLSTDFAVETYVPRPGTGPRAYLLVVTVEPPDTSDGMGTGDMPDFVPILQREFRLGPRATTIHVKVSNRELRRLVQPLLRAAERRTATWEGSVDLILRPVPLPRDAEIIPPGILDGNAGYGGYVRLSVPPR